VFNGAISPVVASLAYVADVLQPKYRGAGFGLVLAVFAAGIAVTPKVGYALGVERAITWGVWMKIAGIVYTFVRPPLRCTHPGACAALTPCAQIWLPESLSAEARTLARIKRAEKKSAAGALYPTREERATYSSAGVAPAVCAWRAVSRFPPVRSLYQVRDWGWGQAAWADRAQPVRRECAQQTSAGSSPPRSQSLRNTISPSSRASPSLGATRSSSS